MDNLIEIKNLCKDYGDFKLKNINLNVPKGFIMGFAGQNGAGKTTVMRSLLGMTDYSGECLIMGKDARKYPKIKENIGVVFDELFYMQNLTPIELEKQIMGFYSNWDRGEYRKLLNKFGLQENKKIKSFSIYLLMKQMMEQNNSCKNRI